MSVLKKILGLFKIILVVLMIIFIVCFCSIVYQKKVMKVGMPNLFGYTGGAIVSGSMEPNIHVGDYVIVDVNGGYNKGDVVMFKRGNAYIAHRVMDVFDDYIIWGGMPQRFSMNDELQVKTYLSDVYNSIVVKDIVERFKIKDLDLFNKILTFIITTPSQTFSAESLSNYLFSENVEVSKMTLYNYLEYMCRAMLINKAERFDVRGKRILNGKYKYYLTDLGLGQVINNERKKQMGAYIENIVYNELLSRGYDVKVGNLAFIIFSALSNSTLNNSYAG